MDLSPGTVIRPFRPLDLKEASGDCAAWVMVLLDTQAVAACHVLKTVRFDIRARPWHEPAFLKIFYLPRKEPTW